MTIQRLGKIESVALLAVSMLAGAAACGAQAPAMVQLPFGSTVAGLAPGSGATQCSSSVDIPTIKGTHLGDGCLPTQATLFAPAGTAVDALGNIYIADYSNTLLRVVYNGGAQLAAAITAANALNAPNLVPQPGHIYTLAGGWTGSITLSGSPKKYYCNGNGTGTVGVASNGDGCPGAESYAKPRGVTLDKDGNVFFTNLAGGQTVRVFMVNPGVASAPTAAANLLTTLYGSTLTAPPQTGFVYSIAGTTVAAYFGDGGNAQKADFISIRDVAVDANENVYLSDGAVTVTTANGVNTVTASSSGANTVRMINGSTGIITTIAGGTGCTEATTATTCTADAGFSGDGGLAAKALLSAPYTLFLDSNSNLYIADSANGRLRVIYNSGTVPGLTNPVAGNIYTVAGGGTSTTSGSPARQIAIAELVSAGIDTQGNLYVGDASSRYFWRIDASTAIATLIAGNGITISGSVVTANPTAAAGKACNLGSGGPLSTDTLGDGCPGLQAAVSSSMLLAFDTANNLYETESTNAVIRRFSMNDQLPSATVGSSIVQPLAYQLLTAQTLNSESFSLQGGATAEFSDAGGDTCALGQAQTAGVLCVVNVAFAPSAAGARNGSFLLSSSAANAPLVYLSGTGVSGMESGDPGAQFSIGSGLKPSGVGTDALGNLYIADSANGQVLRAPAAGGTATAILSGLSSPGQVAVDGAGNVYVADAGNNRIAELPAGSATVVSVGSGLNKPAGVVVDGMGNLYVADTGNKRIVKILPGGVQQTLAIGGLNTPTGLALDLAGDLFVADPGSLQVVELQSNGTQTVFNAVVTPEGVAIDAAGDVYIADSSSEEVLLFPAGSTTGSVLGRGLQSPVGLAIDQNGSVYVAELQATGALVIDRAAASLSFPITNVNQATTVPLLLSNSGNAPFSFTGSQFATATGDTAVFSLVSGTSSPCALATPVPSATQCQLTASFLPTDRGTYSETATLVTNAANSATADVVLTGTGFQLISTTVVVQVTSPSGSIVYAQPVTVSGTVTPQITAGAMTGTLTFTVDGAVQPAQPLGSGTVAQKLNLAAGTHVVSVSYSGDAVYASSSGQTSFTIAPAVTKTVLTLSVGISGGNPQLALQATVSSTTASNPGGTVTFYAGTAAIGSAAVNAQGVASFTTSTVNYSSYSFTAAYNGTPNFAQSTSTPVLPTADFLLYTTSTSVATAQGGVVSMAITVNPLFNFSGTVTASCGNLPANAVCRFQPVSLSMSGTAAQTESILIYTNVPSNLAQSQSPTGPGSVEAVSVVLAGLFPGVLFLLLPKQRRKRWVGLLIWMLVLGAAAGLSGCSNGTASTSQPTPPGIYAITVDFAGPNSLDHSMNLSFTVNGN